MSKGKLILVTDKGSLGYPEESLDSKENLAKDVIKRLFKYHKNQSFVSARFEHLLAGEGYQIEAFESIDLTETVLNLLTV